MGRPHPLVVLLAFALVGCAVPSNPTPVPSTDPSVVKAQACAAAVSSVVDAVRAQVEPYNTQPSTSGPSSTEPARPGPSNSQTSSAEPTAAPQTLDTVLVAARATVESQNCDRGRFLADVEAGLGKIRTDSPIAAAILRRLTASIAGRIPERPTTQSVSPEDDLREVLAEAPPGSTLNLTAGRFRLSETLVLLDGISLTGVSRSRTTISTRAADAGILVISDSRIDLKDLAIYREPGTSGSGIITGPAAALVLTRVAITGNKATKGKQGGAGVHLSAQASDRSPTGTTLEVTDSVFTDNSWAGIAVTGRHRVSLLRTRFNGNGECGVCFLDGGQGSVSNSRFTKNGVGVASVGTSGPAIIDNTIEGGQVGVQIGGTAKPQLKGNTISRSSRAAVIYTDRAGGTIERTTCREVRFGIVVGKNAAPTVLKNGCALAGGG